ncbi:MAG: RDD family protein, partial [Cellulomonadaceae bacterium]|nr:RDD family protein [Cellulomonadaceae bacterium]
PPAYGEQQPYGQPPAYPQPSAYGQPAGSPYGQQPAYGQPYAAAPAYAQGAYGEGGYGGPRLAPWIQRVLALILDNLVFGVPYGIGALFAAVTSVPGYDQYGQPASVPTTAGSIAVLVGIAVGFALHLWNRWVRQGRTGQSLGKSALKIRLVGELTGQPIGAGKAFLRDICHVVDGILYLGYLWPLWDAKKQTFSDKIMGTLVIEA